MNDRVQDIYNDTEHLATALDAIKTKDDVSQGVLVAVKAALYANSELAGIVSDMFCEHALPYQVEASSMSDDTFINQVMDGLKEQGYLMINDDFIDQLIITLHANVTIINTMTQLAELETKMLGSLLPTGSRQVESLKELSKRIAEIAFNVEDVRNDQR
ncbi:hypothetical protein JCM18902_1259 [Psychrobacter sp. JCM 18902]|nr:hypothetical protein JCM18902_1259 [Psychrobacter sp. JCM 18902]